MAERIDFIEEILADCKSAKAAEEAVVKKERAKLDKQIATKNMILQEQLKRVI